MAIVNKRNGIPKVTCHTCKSRLDRTEVAIHHGHDGMSRFRCTNCEIEALAGDAARLAKQQARVLEQKARQPLPTKYFCATCGLFFLEHQVKKHIYTSRGIHRPGWICTKCDEVKWRPSNGKRKLLL